MTDRHKHQPITFRPAEGDRAWLLAYAERTGQPVRRVLALALAAFRAAHSGDTTTPAETPQTAHVETPVETPRPARKPRAPAAAKDSTKDKCPHPKARVLRGLCRACGTYVGAS